MGVGGGRQRGRHRQVGGDHVRAEEEPPGERAGDHDALPGTCLANRPCSAWRRVFPGRVAAVPEVRAWARGLLTGRVTAGALDDVLLLLSELATNAVTHSDSGRTADGRMTVYVARLPGAVHVEVTDEGSDASAPAVRVPGTDDDGGRGLWLVEAVAAGWGTYRDGTGGSVWFRVTG
ncbi:ATP-binding protein [Streptosporangium sp. NPDC023615]|uniref:ATP-binding protein n=1 Tax=Streptosporangium sp. NPDC023615 TaxID=3154794 RepID=UPI003427D16E